VIERADTISFEQYAICTRGNKALHLLDQSVCILIKIVIIIASDHNYHVSILIRREICLQFDFAN
jgi:hypothetical protein